MNCCVKQCSILEIWLHIKQTLLIIAHRYIKFSKIYPEQRKHKHPPTVCAHMPLAPRGMFSQYVATICKRIILFKIKYYISKRYLSSIRILWFFSHPDFMCHQTNIISSHVNANTEEKNKGRRTSGWFDRVKWSLLKDSRDSC